MKNILVICLVIMTATIFAAPVTQAQAMQAALNWTARWAPQEYRSKSINKIIPLGEKSQSLAYLFQFEDGFVLTSSDDSVIPILSYGFNTKVGNIDDNPAFRDYLQEVQQEISQIIADNADNSITSERWREVLSNNLPRNETRSVPPLLSTKWDQDWPYNMFCPVDAAGPGGHVLAGCVATAMGQIMKYWNWPVTGVGTHTYYAQGYGSLTANFGATTYQWAQMPNSVHMPNEAVGWLLYHCGIAVDMNYSPTGSGAFSQEVVTSLMQHFRYSSGITLKHRNNYSPTTWVQMLKTELNNARPLYYHGFGPDGGHAFVCDGYQGTDYFHFNWGWSGLYDGYFYLNNLNPGYTFTNGQGAIFNVTPLNYNISSMQMHLQSIDCYVGDIATVSVVSYPILPNWNINNLSFVIEYDETYMRYSGFDTAGTILAGSNVTTSLVQPGRMMVSAVSGNALMGSGALLKLNFLPLAPGSFVFNLANFSLNTTSVAILMPVTIDVSAEITEVQNTSIDILNALAVTHNTLVELPMTTTFVLPTWNVTSVNFAIQYPMALVTWEGYEAAGCFAEDAVVNVMNYGNGNLSFSLNFADNLVGRGNLIKLKFRATGNSSTIALAAITFTNFSVNQTPIANTLPGYIVLLPVTGAEDGIALTESSLMVGPNPFRTALAINLNLSKANQKTEINIYNLKGQLVRKLYNDELKGTSLSIGWDGKDNRKSEVPAGIYLLRVKTDGYEETQKIIRIQ